MTKRAKPVAVIVSAHKLKGPASSGREKLLRGTQAAFAKNYEVVEFQVPSLFDVNILRKLVSLSDFVRDLLFGGNPTIQGLLFSSHLSEFRQLIANVQPDAVYVDGVRLLNYALEAKKAHAKVFIDLDDLLSRRLNNLQRLGFNQEGGKLGEKLPKIISSLLSNGFVSNAYISIDKWLIRRAEVSAARTSDVLIMTSPKEARILSRFCRRHKSLSVFPQYNPLMIPMANSSPNVTFSRFSFVGTEKLVQNRDGISWCQRVARDSDVKFDIYGTKLTNDPEIPNITYHGFVEDIAEAYDRGAVSTCMTRVRGGVKTKILEAWAIGVPVLVTPEALDGIDIVDYPLTADWSCSFDDVKAQLDPASMKDAVEKGRRYLYEVYGGSVGRWAALLAAD